MLIAFKNTTVTKPTILKQLRAHAAADQIVSGQYWQNGKGCAVGCTIHSSDHAEYETRFGIPQMLARLEDCIFEGLPNGKAKAWPVRFMSAVQPGADLSCVGWQFLHWLLTDEKVNPGIYHPLVRDAVKQCADVVARPAKGLPINKNAALSAESARSAAWSAESARSAALSAASAASAESARSAALSAESAASARSARSARSAAASAAWSAASAAWSAESAALSARSAVSAESARSARSAAWSAESAAYVRMSDTLVSLIKVAPKVKS